MKVDFLLIIYFWYCRERPMRDRRRSSEVEQIGARPHLFRYGFFCAHKPWRSREERVGHGVVSNDHRDPGTSPV